MNFLNKTTTIVPLSILVILALGYFVILPMMSSLKEFNLKIAAKDQENSEMGQKISDLNSLKTEFNNAKQDVELLGLALPSSDQVPEILVQLETIANKSGMIISNLQPGKSSSLGTAFNLTTQGNFSALDLFVNSLEKNLRPIQIKSMNLSSSTNSTGGSILNVTFSLDIFKVKGGDNE